MLVTLAKAQAVACDDGDPISQRWPLAVRRPRLLLMLALAGATASVVQQVLRDEEAERNRG